MNTLEVVSSEGEIQLDTIAALEETWQAYATKTLPQQTTFMLEIDRDLDTNHTQALLAAVHDGTFRDAWINGIAILRPEWAPGIQINRWKTLCLVVFALSLARILSVEVYARTLLTNRKNELDRLAAY